MPMENAPVAAAPFAGDAEGQLPFTTAPAPPPVAMEGEMRQTYNFDANQQPTGGMRPEGRPAMDGRGGYPGMGAGGEPGMGMPGMPGMSGSTSYGGMMGGRGDMFASGGEGRARGEAAPAQPPVAGGSLVPQRPRATLSRHRIPRRPPPKSRPRRLSIFPRRCPRSPRNRPTRRARPPRRSWRSTGRCKDYADYRSRSTGLPWEPTRSARMP